MGYLISMEALNAIIHQPITGRNNLYVKLFV